MQKPRLFIVAALISRIENGEKQVALFQRKSTDVGAGLWEFPGGKIEDKETPEQALVREIEEELSLTAVVQGFFGQNEHEVENRILDLVLYHVQLPNYNWVLNDHDQYVWVNRQNWKNWEVAPLDIPLLEEFFNKKLS